MQISKITTNTNFKGIFEKDHIDTNKYWKQRIEKNVIHAIYHPFKNETDEQIKKAVDKFEQKTEHNIEYKKRKSRSGLRDWEVINTYKAEVGERLDYDGESVTYLTNA